MRKNLYRVTLIITLLISFSFSTNAQVLVRVRPVAPVVVRPIAPSPRHIWMDGNWVWRGNRYVYADGYWMIPRQGYRWVPGHWRHSFRGWIWRPGHWRI